MSKAKKLVLVSAISTSMTDVRKKALDLECVPYIHYPIQFKKDINNTQVQALINLESEVNAIHPTLVKELGLLIKPSNVGVQEINISMLDTYGMVVAAFLMADNANRVRFFEETFLVANVSPEIVLRMLFLTLSGVDVDFLDQECNWLNLVITIRLRRVMLSVNGWIHVLCHVLRHVTQRIVKSWRGAQSRELHWLSWVGKVTWEDHVSKDKWEERCILDNSLSQT